MFCQAIISDLTETNKGFLARANRFQLYINYYTHPELKENVAVTIYGSFSSAILTRKVIEGERAVRERDWEEILALAAACFPKWHLRCVWREADERLRLKEGGGGEKERKRRH